MKYVVYARLELGIEVDAETEADALDVVRYDPDIEQKIISNGSLVFDEQADLSDEG